MDEVVIETVALDDPPEVKENNPIHGSGAQAAGYERPIVGGLSSYAWAIASVVELFGDTWLDHGWSEYRLRRPVYAGEPVRAVATPTGDDTCDYVLLNEEGKATVEGRAGLGLGPWSNDPWQLPTNRAPVPPADPPARVLPEDAPGRGDLPAMRMHLSVEDVHDWATARMGDNDPRYSGDQPYVHPSWVVGVGVPLIQHSMRGPDVGIHTGRRVQHLRPLRAPVDLVLCGRWILHERRKERWWSAIDFLLQTEDGEEFAYHGQESILLPPFDLS